MGTAWSRETAVVTTQAERQTARAQSDDDAVVSFSGHETFPLRYGWPKKCVDAVGARADFFTHDDAMVSLGVGKNMVKAIRHWGLATRVIEHAPGDLRGRALRVTELGGHLFGDDGVDPYLEDPRTLWLLHWLICTHPEKCTTWSWAFGALERHTFSRDELLRELQSAGFATRATAASLGRDIDVFLRTYVPSRAGRGVPIEDTLDGPLVELRLLRERPGERRYEFVRGPKPSLDATSFGFAVLDFWERVAPERETLSLDELLRHPGSPGRIFKLDTDSAAERLERASQWSSGAVRYDETAGLRQLLRRERVSALDWLRARRTG